MKDSINHKSPQVPYMEYQLSRRLPQASKMCMGLHVLSDSEGTSGSRYISIWTSTTSFLKGIW